VKAFGVATPARTNRPTVFAADAVKGAVVRIKPASKKFIFFFFKTGGGNAVSRLTEGSGTGRVADQANLAAFRNTITVAWNFFCTDGGSAGNSDGNTSTSVVAS
jgi:hypothetical protein